LTTEEILKYLETISDFSKFDSNFITSISTSIEVKECKLGEVLAKEGDPEDRYFIVYQGALRIKKIVDGVSKSVDKLQEGNTFGSLKSEDKKSFEYSIVSAKKSIILILDKTKLNLEETIFNSESESESTLNIDQIKEDDKEVIKPIPEESQSSIITALSGLKEFKSLDAESLKLISKNSKVIDLKLGEKLAEEETVQDSIFYILSGIIRVKKKDGNLYKTIAKLEAGNFTGDLNFEQDKVWYSQVTCAKKGSVLKIDLQDIKVLSMLKKILVKEDNLEIPVTAKRDFSKIDAKEPKPTLLEDEIKDVFSKLEIFESLSSDELDLLCRYFLNSK